MLSKQKPRQAAAQIDQRDRQAILIGRLVGFFLATGFLVYFKWQSSLFQELAFLALIFPAGLQIRHGMAPITRIMQSFLPSLLYLVPIALSFLFHPVDSTGGLVQNFVIVLNLFFAFFVASVFSSDGVVLKESFKSLGLFVTPIFLYVAITQQHAYVWGRWEPFEMQPNWWGMMALGLTWSSFLWTNKFVRFLMLGTALFFMGAAQSRGSIVAFVPALLFSSGYFFPLDRKKMRHLSLCFFCLVVALSVTTIFFEAQQTSKIGNFFWEDIMKLNDPHRGINSGMSGRTEGYETAWNAFLGSPLFGAGFGDFGFVHNGFLLTLAESGFLALFGMLYLIFRSLFNHIKAKNWVLAGFTISYIASLMTFPRSFNINMTGLLFMIVMAYGLKNRTPPSKNEIQKQNTKYGRKIKPHIQIKKL